ncbi:GTP-binding protein RHO3 [Rhodotorula toruloides]|nr:GTP-binding protein RHO3 [Rhodotorula toruloides]
MPALCGLPLPGSNGGHDHAGNGYGLSGTSTKEGRPLGRKVVVVGDGACGKTSLLNVYVKGEFPELYEPTVFENHCVDIVVDGTPIELALWDTAGQEDFDRLRSLSYADSNVVLLCFSVDQPTSLENVKSKWVDEIRHYCPGVKLALVALKCDLRSDPVVRDKLASAGMQPVEYEEVRLNFCLSLGVVAQGVAELTVKGEDVQGLAVAKRIRASRYLECSAKHNRGVQETFEEAARVSITARRAGETRGSQAGHGGGGGGGDKCAVM